MSFPELFYDEKRNEIYDSKGNLIASIIRNNFIYNRKVQLAFGTIFAAAPKLGSILLQLWSANQTFMESLQDDTISEETAEEAAKSLAQAQNKAAYALVDLGVLQKLEEGTESQKQSNTEEIIKKEIDIERK